LEAVIRGPRQDLHSGVFGGAVANPANAMARIIAKMHDDEGRVLIPGFYDDVEPISNQERQDFAGLPFDEASFCEGLGVDAVYGEPGFSTLERRWVRPTFDVNGIISGYTGEGPKSIVPAEARCKFGCRLVPNQDPRKIEASLKERMQSHCPPGLTLTFLQGHLGWPSVCATSSPYMAAAREALEAGFGRAPVLIREGGSIPIVYSFREQLGVDTLLLGWGRNSDNLHSPNEHFHLDDFRHGTLASAHLWAAIGKTAS
jgi:acetylornithine deacetylase/succinyl-diaminopimelate desuccinylase-like protein